MSNYLAIQDMVLSFRFSDSNYRPVVKIWINEAQRDVCLRADLSTQFTTSTITTTAGTQGYALPSNYARLGEKGNLSIPTYDEILNELEDQDDFDDTTPSSGKPTSYIIIGATLYLYPTPDAVYSLTLRYYKLPADLVNNTDEPEIPEQYHHLLEHYAQRKAYERESDRDMAQYHAGIYETEMAKLLGQVNYANHDHARQVPGAWEEPSISSNTWY